MSYGEGNLRERVAELEDENAVLARKVDQLESGTLVSGAVGYWSQRVALAEDARKAMGGRVEELEELLDSSHQTIHAMQGKLVELEAEKARMLMLVGKLHDLLLRKVVTSSALREFCNEFIAEFGDAEGGE